MGPAPAPSTAAGYIAGPSIVVVTRVRLEQAESSTLGTLSYFTFFGSETKTNCLTLNYEFASTAAILNQSKTV